MGRERIEGGEIANVAGAREPIRGKLNVDGEDLLVLNEHDILAKVAQAAAKISIAVEVVSSPTVASPSDVQSTALTRDA